MADGRMNRRGFLAKAACGAAAAAAPRLFAAAPATQKQPWVMRLSTSSIQYTALPIEKACERIAALGFEAIDIWSAHAGCPHLDDVAKRLGGKGLKELLAKHKLKLYAFSVYRGGYRQYAQLLGDSGGGVAVRGSAGGGKPAELRSQMKTFLDGLKADAELAEKYDSYIAIENHGGALLNSLDSFKAFVELNTSKRVGIALAPYHLQRAKVSVEEAIAVAGKQLLFFYAWQSAGGVGQLPGHGKTDFKPWLAALAKADYRWYVNPFMHHQPAPEEVSAALAKSRDYLRTCYEEAVGKQA